MSLAQGNNTPTRPRIEPGSQDPESDALTTRPVRPHHCTGKLNRQLAPYGMIHPGRKLQRSHPWCNQKKGTFKIKTCSAFEYGRDVAQLSNLKFTKATATFSVKNGMIYAINDNRS